MIDSVKGLNTYFGLYAIMEDYIPQTVFNIQVGDLELIGDGTVISPDLEPVSITIEDMTIDFEFDFGGSEAGVETNVISEKNLQLRLINHGGGVIMGQTSPPMGPEKPISIGSLSDRELLLNYRLTTEYRDEKAAGVILSYNFYLGEEITAEELEEQNDG